MIQNHRPTSNRRAPVCALLFTLVAALALTGAPAAANPLPSPGPDQSRDLHEGPTDTGRAGETEQRIRDAGTALMSWITDAAAGQQWPSREEGADNTWVQVDWAQCLEIGYEDLESLLVPDYIHELPATDAWGHRLEFCLDRNPTPPAQFLAGVRSPGRDGTFEGDTYRRQAFPESDVDRDTVWIDGYFITWPSDKTD